MTEVATSQPPPATDGDSPWGSFYTASASGSAPVKVKVKEKKAKKAKGKAKRKRSAEPTAEVSSSEPTAETSPSEPTAETEKTGRRARRSRKAARGTEDKRRSFRLRRGPREGHQDAPAPQPVVAAARSRRYAEPHVLVGVVGSTIIALSALLIALLYMIGNAA